MDDWNWEYFLSFFFYTCIDVVSIRDKKRGDDYLFIDRMDL